MLLLRPRLTAEVGHAQADSGRPAGLVLQCRLRANDVRPSQYPGALFCATVGTAVLVATAAAIGAIVCQAVDREPCLIKVPASRVAGTALMLGGSAGLADPVKVTTIYMRP